MKPKKRLTVDDVLSLRACTVLRYLFDDTVGSWTADELFGPLQSVAVSTGYTSAKAYLMAQRNCGRRTAQEIVEWCGIERLPRPMTIPADSIPNPVAVHDLTDAVDRMRPVLVERLGSRIAADVLPAGLLLMVAREAIPKDGIVLQVDDGEPVTLRRVDVEMAGMGIFARAIGKMASDPSFLARMGTPKLYAPSGMTTEILDHLTKKASPAPDGAGGARTPRRQGRRKATSKRRRAGRK